MYEFSIERQKIEIELIDNEFDRPIASLKES